MKWYLCPLCPWKHYDHKRLEKHVEVFHDPLGVKNIKLGEFIDL